MVELLPLLLAMPILLWIAWTDFWFLRIRNKAVFAAGILFLLTAPLLGWQEASLRLLAAALVFSAAFALFAARLMGGGDVKMGSALLLFIPSGTYSLFAFLFSAALVVTISVIVLLRWVPTLRRAGPVSLRAQGTVPMGLAFGLSGLLHLGILAAAGY